jgi:hypothetical protein
MGYHAGEAQRHTVRGKCSLRQSAGRRQAGRSQKVAAGGYVRGSKQEAATVPTHSSTKRAPRADEKTPTQDPRFYHANSPCQQPDAVFFHTSTASLQNHPTPQSPIRKLKSEILCPTPPSAVESSQASNSKGASTGHRQTQPHHRRPRPRSLNLSPPGRDGPARPERATRDEGKAQLATPKPQTAWSRQAFCKPLQLSGPGGPNRHAFPVVGHEKNGSCPISGECRLRGEIMATDVSRAEGPAQE